MKVHAASVVASMACIVTWLPALAMAPLCLDGSASNRQLQLGKHASVSIHALLAAVACGVHLRFETCLLQGFLLSECASNVLG
jgi:hypothetical protein